MFYSGIDQHKRDSFITTYDAGGAIVNQERVPNTPLHIQRYFAQFPGSHKAVVYSSGSRIFPAKMIVPEKRSRITKTNGRSTRNGPGAAEVTLIPTDVAAAASVPSSFTSTKVLCLTSLMKRSFSERILEKLATP